MTITPIGYLIIVVGLVALFWPSRRMLLYAMIFFVPFTATAVVNFDDPTFGLQPAYFLGILLMGRIAFEQFGAKRSAGLGVFEQRSLFPFYLFLLLAGLSILLIPFYQHIFVQRPSGEVQQLRLSMENMTQFMYLSFVILTTLSIAACKLEPHQMRLAIRVLLVSSVFVCLWGWLQLYMHYAGIPYPDFIFNNSASFIQKYGQRIRFLGFKRMNSVAPEPSMFARFLLTPTFLCFYYAYNKGQSVIKPKAAFALSTFLALTLVFTSSSTALLGLAGGLVIFIGYIFSKRGRISGQVYTFQKSLRTVLVAVLGIFGLPLVLFGIAIFVFRFRVDEVYRFLEILLIDKADSESGGSRLEGALQGLQLFWNHPLLGVGWGSNRTFDLMTNLLSTVGSLGTVVFVWGHLLLARRTRWLTTRCMRMNQPMLAEFPKALFFALMVRILGKILSEPDILFLDHWLIVGMIIGALHWAYVPVASGPKPVASPANSRREFLLNAAAV